MWLEVQGFIETLLDRYGLWKVLTGPFALIGMLGALGLATRNNTTSLIAVILSFFFALVLIVFFAYQWRSTSAGMADRARTLTRYAERFIRQADYQAFAITDWRESVTVGRNGDSTIERWITISVGAHELYSCWSANYSTTTSELAGSQKRRIKVEARSFDENRQLGARYDVTDDCPGVNNACSCIFRIRPRPGT
jgi:hypothetical protein